MSVGRKAPGFNAVYLGDAAELAMHQAKQKQLDPEAFRAWTLNRIAELATTQPPIRQQLEKLATEADQQLTLAMSAASDALECAQRQVDAAEAQLTTYQQLLGHGYNPVPRDRQAEREHCEATIPGYTEARAMPLPVVVSLEQRTMSLPQRRRRTNAR